MKNGTNFTIESVREWNVEQMKLREDLPSFYDALIMAQDGDWDTLSLFFFFKKKIGSYFYDGRRQASVDTELEFMDTSIHYFLRHLKNIYSDNRGITSVDGIGGQNYKITTTSVKFEEEEIDMYFYEYIMDFVGKHDLSKFNGTSETHRNNNLYKYIKIDFENSVLKTEYNKRMDVDRVQIDGEQYTVKNKLEEVFFDDITVNKDENDSDEDYLDFLGILDSEILDTDRREYGRDKQSQFIYDNYEDVMTKNQNERFQQLLDWCNEDGNSIDDLFQRNNPYELSKSALSAIFYPDRKTTSTMRNIDDLFKSMNSRMNKALDRAGVKKDKVPVRSDYAKVGLSFEDNRLLKEYKIEENVIGRQKSNLPNHSMYDRFKKKSEHKGFIEPEHYEQVLNGEMTVQALINMYEIDKDKINTKNGIVVTSIPVESNHVEHVNGTITNNNNMDNSNSQEERFKIINVDLPEEKERKGMITDIELGRIRRESMERKK